MTGGTRAHFPVSSHGADQNPYYLESMLLNLQEFTTFPANYHMVINLTHIAKDVVHF